MTEKQRKQMTTKLRQKMRYFMRLKEGGKAWERTAQEIDQLREQLRQD